MNHPDYNSPLALKAFLDENGMAMQKKFGQNFLVNSDARKKIVDCLDLQENTSVWEVGPGLGCMTDEILSRGAKVTVFEIDHGFVRLIKEFFKDYSDQGKFNIVEGDVLKTWKKHFEENGLAQRFFGNLPYNIAAAIVGDTINAGVRFDRAIITVQKEVAQRMAARENTDSYSSFSVLCQWAYKITNVLDLAGGNFWPVPNVASRSVLMEKREDFPRCKNPQFFMKMIRQLFSSRRKTVRNNLLNMALSADKIDLALNKAGINPSARAESLSIERLLTLSDAVNEVM